MPDEDIDQKINCTLEVYNLSLRCGLVVLP